jgi:cation diffusion facilitator CzcD-associated flavoprotein CzcO
MSGTWPGENRRMYDVIIIGAGVSGLYQLHRVRELGLSAHVFEAGDDVGGTWYWNRYPGARFDSESYTYAYSFSQELLDEWVWTEHFSAQPETLAYLEHVAERFDLRRDITFGCRISGLAWHEDERAWRVVAADGRTAASRFVILAIGALSKACRPKIEGLDEFRGAAFHTSEWPHEPVELAGRRVGVIGTGATGVQVIQEVAKVAGHLTVFQRTPQWCAPLRNTPIDDATRKALRASQAAMFERCRNTFGGFLHDSDRRKAMMVSPEERVEFYEQLYRTPGFAIWMGNFRDVLVDERANATLSEFMADKIRERVHDPAIAEKLIPTNHGFGTRRVPLETDYYEVYNERNVELVDVRGTPIVRATATGITTAAGHHELDVLVLATGFDAVTGPFESMSIRGFGGVGLDEAWRDGPRTYLGLGVAGFPNLFILVGPHNASSFCNMPRCIEHNVDWVSRFLESLTKEGSTRVCPTDAAQDEWTAEVHELAERMLFSKVDSWFTGRNSAHADISGRRVLLYAGGFPKYQERCQAVADDAYAGFERA